MLILGYEEYDEFTGNLVERKVGRSGISNKRKDLSRFLVWLNLDKIKREEEVDVIFLVQ